MCEEVLNLSSKCDVRIMRVKVGRDPFLNRLLIVSPEKELRKFVEAHAGLGMVGLFGGSSWAHRLVRRGQKPLTRSRKPSLWSHAVIFGQKGANWVVYESDWDVGIRPIRFRVGAQMSSLEKYLQEERWRYVAILDFSLEKEQRELLLEACGQMVERGYKYPLLDLLYHGLKVREGREARYALKAVELLRRAREFLGLRRPSLYCSAFVQMALERAGIVMRQNGETLAPQELFDSGHVRACYVRQKEWRTLVDLGEISVDEGSEMMKYERSQG